MAEYDAIAREYRESKRLPFREHVERYTLFELVGDVRDRTVLDLACGDGFYTRLLRQAGAREVQGVDVSEGMIELAQERERQHPIGCRYACADVATFEPGEPVDLVVAAYLLNYARTPEQLSRFCRVCHRALRPGGRFVGLNNNVRNVAFPSGSLSKYGLERTWNHPLGEGDAIRYTMFNADGTRVRIRQLLPDAEDPRGGVRTGGVARISLDRRVVAPVAGGQPVLGRIHGEPADNGFRGGARRRIVCATVVREEQSCR